MANWTRRILLGSPLGLGFVGCTAPNVAPPVTTSSVLPPSYQHLAKSTPAAPRYEPANPIQQVADTQPKPPETPKPLPQPAKETDLARPRPAYGQLETLPIDLPTVLRLVDQNSPNIGIAQARIREAQARLRGAELQWLPNLSVGVGYNRFDGQTQNQGGSVFSVSRSNLFGSLGPTFTIDTAEAFYRPLIERRLTAVEQLRAQATGMSAELEAVSAYLDLVQVHAQLDINADTLQKAEAMLSAAMAAKEAKLDRSAGDVNRAQSEVLFRRTERIDLEGRVGVASARLGRLLLLQPNVRLVPGDAAVTLITLVDPARTVDDLVSQAIATRPDLAANREAIQAAWTRLRRQECGPFFPKFTLANQTGVFGGGINDHLRQFEERNQLSAQLYWEVKNLGFGNRADAAERRALLDQAHFANVEAQARVTAEIVEAAQLASAKYESLDLAERAVKEATELYRINKEGTLNVVDAKNLFDALRPLQAIQVLNQARVNYLNAVLDFNRAQYRLLTAVGNPPKGAVTP